jgi:predicted lipid-binding transport protein (Tim44 family)
LFNFRLSFDGVLSNTETQMKSFLLMAAAITLGLTIGVGDAEAKRLGGGKSAGMQREAVSPQKAPPAAAPAQQAPTQAAAKPATAQPAAAPAAQPKRSWMGPLAGLAAGLGLAALASHFGFGEELASMLLIGLAVLAVLMVVGYFMRKRAMAQQPAGGMQYAGAGAPFGREEPVMQPVEQQPMQRAANGTPVIGSAIGGGEPIAAEDVVKRNIPADFDVEGFVRNAKVNFIRMQAANDSGNLDDLREFTSPEMFAEIKLDIAERKGAPQQTEVVTLNADVLDVAEEPTRYVVSVRFNGEIIEERGAAAAPFDEVWHLSKPRDGSRGWVIAGIQQVQ